MRRNLPITDRVIPLAVDAVLSSTTDPKGRVLEVNEDFVRYSGFSRDELIGQAHNIVRHPDMPEAVFADMWVQLKAGRCWRGIVKNRCKNGDSYWVDANVSPKYEGERLVGFVSVRRTVPASVDLQALAHEYQRVARGEIEVEGGHLRRRLPGWVRVWRRLAIWRPTLFMQLVLAALPLLALLLVLTWSGADALWEDYRQAQKSSETVVHWNARMAAVGALQRERGRSAGYQALPEPVTRTAMLDARQAFDIACERIQCDLASTLAQLRKRVDDHAVDGVSLLQEFSALVDAELRGMTGEIQGLQGLRDQRFAIELMERARLGEALAIERGTLQQVLAGGRDSRGLAAAQYARELAASRTLAMLGAPGADALQAQLDEGLRSTEAFRDADVGATPQLRMDAFAAYTRWIDGLAALASERAESWLQSSQHAEARALREAWLAGIMLTLGMAVAIGLIWRLQSRMVSGIRRIGKVLEGVATAGDFHARVDLPDRGDELSALCRLTDLSLNQVERSLVAVSDVMAGVAAGDMRRRVTDSLSGDLGLLKERTNRAVDALDGTMQELAGVMLGLAAGDLQVRLSGRVRGELRDQVNHTLIGLEATLKAVGSLLAELAQGQFGGTLECRSEGAFGALESDVDRASRALSEAVQRISAAVAALSDGRLDAPIPQPLQGEFETVRGDFNQALQSLSNLVRQAQQTADSVASGSERMCVGSEQLNMRSQQQAASLEETAAAMEQLASSVRQTDQQASSAQDQSAEVQALTENCSTSMGAVRDAMRRSLGSSDAIAGAVELIESIAFQTNLLALNAAVEAARAGDQGRGFAVVASEVRALAGRAAAGVAQIRQLIEAARADTRSGAQRVESAAADLAQVRVALSGLEQAVAEIAGAAREQASGIEQVNQAVMELDDLTQQNAGLAESTAASVQDMRMQAETLSEVLGALRLAEAQRPGERCPPRPAMTFA